MARPLPQPSAWSAPYWDAAREHRLVLQRCDDCDAALMYPKRLCPQCLGENLSWQDAAGTGEVYTYTEQVASAPSGFEDLLPYTLAVVRLDEGVQLMTNIVGAGAEDVSCGDRVRVDFAEITGADGARAVLPVFRLEAAS